MEKLTAEFTKSMRKTHTIYMPQMLHYHNELLCAAFAYGGYHLEVVPEHQEFIKETYSSIGKDYCTCAFGIVGNIMTFVKEQGCNTDNIAFLEPQAGGACRAGNYYNLIIECLKKMDCGHIPVLSLNFQGKETHEGFNINPKMFFGAVAAVCYGDILMTIAQQVRPYEVNPGETEALRMKWISKLSEDIAHGKNVYKRKKIYREIAESFSAISVDKTRKKTKVGIVGEIYIKFSPVGNFHLEDFLYDNNCDIRQGGFLNYCSYVVLSEEKTSSLNGKNPLYIEACRKVLDYFCRIQKEFNEVITEFGYKCDMPFKEMEKAKGNILSDHYNIGDGWLMAGEIIDLSKQGYDKIMIVHPFGCLVSHVGGRGVIKELKKMLPGTKITSVEFDIEQAKTLRESRILMAIV